MSESIRVPRLNANEDTVELVHRYRADGEAVKSGDDLVDIATTKATFTVTSPRDGFVAYAAAVGERLAVGAELARVSASYEPLIRKETASTSKGARFSAAAREILSKRGECESNYQGLVTKHDLEVGRREKLSLPKRLEVSALVQGHPANTTSSLTVEWSSQLLRERLRKQHLLGGQVLPVILAELARLLKAAPKFTAYYENDEIHYYDAVNLGVALDLDRGLRVPVVKEAEKKSPLAFLEAITDFGKRYLRNELIDDDFAGGTFTVSDLSGLGVRNFQPLPQRRQAAILGIGGDLASPGQPLTFTLAFDHRVASGREAAEVLSALKTALENPTL